MMVVVRLFAGLRERAGAKSVVLDLWPGASVADALASDTLRELRADTACLMELMREIGVAHRPAGVTGTVLGVPGA